MPTFPDLASLETSQDGTEYIYGGSVGVNRILGYYRKTAYLHDRPEWAYHLFNVYTMVRNVYTKGMSPAALYAAFDHELTLLIRYVQAYGELARLPQHRHPAIAVYVPTYDAYPKDRLRPKAEGAQQLEQAYLRLCKDLPKTITQLQDRVWLVPCGSTVRLPHLDLYRWLQRQDVQAHHHRILMISHCLTDLHLAHFMPRLHLLESYTGTVREPKQFGERLDGSGVIPFTPITHQVFGDSVHLTPLVKGVLKKSLIAQAVARRWPLRTEAEILSDIVTVGRLTPAQVQKITFYS